MIDYEDVKTESAVVADLAQRSATHETIEDASGNERFVLHSDKLKMVDMQKYEDGRRRKTGLFHTHDRDSFHNFIEIEGTPDNTRIFISPTGMVATAYLNYGQNDYEQGHLDFTAKLTAKETVLFNKLVNMHKSGRCCQKTFAEFLEDWGHAVVAKDGEHNIIDNKKAINAVRNMAIEDKTHTESKTGNFRESRSRFEQIEAKSIEGALPAYFEVEDECYLGMPKRKLRLRFTIGNNEGEPTFKLEIIGLQTVQDELTHEFAEIVSGGFEGDFDVFIGGFDG